VDQPSADSPRRARRYRPLTRAWAGVDAVADHRDALVATLERVEARLRMARLLEDRLPAALRGRVPEALDVVAAARAAVDAGTLGYAAVYAKRG
jgi:hypothetical protein